MSIEAELYGGNQRECRILKTQGYSDAELKKMGFDASTIARATVATGGNRGSSIKTKRCKECGAKCYYLDRSGSCYGCALTEKLSREGKATDSVFADDGWKQCEKHMDHPAIIKAKGSY